MKTLYSYFTTLAFLLFCGGAQSTENNFNLPDGIIYQIAINVNDIPKANTVIDQYHYPFKTIVYDKTHANEIVVGAKSGITLFQFGKYRNYSEVDSMVGILGELGCKEIVVNAYSDGYSISIPEAIITQYNVEIDAYTKQSKRNTESVHLVEVNYLVEVKESKLKHYYSVAVIINNPKIIDLIFDNLTNESVAIINSDKKIYAVGKYESFEDAIEARKKLINGKVNDVFIMAQFFDSRISIEDNEDLEYAIKPVIAFIASK